MIARTGNYIQLDKALKTLVDGGTRYAAFNGDVFGGYSGVSDGYLKYSSVKVVYLFHSD